MVSFLNLSAQTARDFIQNGRIFSWRTFSHGNLINQGELTIANVTGNSFEARQVSSTNQMAAPQVMQGGIFDNDSRVVLLNIGQYREVWIGTVETDRINGKIEGADVDFDLRVYVPPSLEWVASQGDMHENAVAGGFENGVNQQDCRANYNGGMHPGKVVSGNCNIGWGGKEIVATEYEILVNMGNMPLTWVTYAGKIPSNAVMGGSDGTQTYYVGQFTRPDGSVHAGKVFGPPGGYIFNYGYGGAEVTEKSNFRILVKGK